MKNNKTDELVVIKINYSQLKISENIFFFFGYGGNNKIVLYCANDRNEIYKTPYWGKNK